MLLEIIRSTNCRQRKQLRLVNKRLASLVDTVTQPVGNEVVMTMKSPKMTEQTCTGVNFSRRYLPFPSSVTSLKAIVQRWGNEFRCEPKYWSSSEAACIERDQAQNLKRSVANLFDLEIFFYNKPKGMKPGSTSFSEKKQRTRATVSFPIGFAQVIESSKHLKRLRLILTKKMGDHLQLCLTLIELPKLHILELARMTIEPTTL